MVMAMSPQRPQSRAACLPTGLAFSNCWSPERPASLAKQAVARRWLHRRCSLPEEPNAAARLSEMLRLDHPSEVRRTIVAEATRLLQLKSKEQELHNLPASEIATFEQLQVSPPSNPTAGSITCTPSNSSCSLVSLALPSIRRTPSPPCTPSGHERPVYRSFIGRHARCEL
jgi:hypothetical protein